MYRLTVLSTILWAVWTMLRQKSRTSRLRRAALWSEQLSNAVEKGGNKEIGGELIIIKQPSPKF